MSTFSRAKPVGRLAQPRIAAAAAAAFRPEVGISTQHCVDGKSSSWTGDVLGGGAREYVSWVAMFALAQLISPTSVSARLAAASLGLSPQATSFQSHARFATALAFAVWLYVVVVCP